MVGLYTLCFRGAGLPVLGQTQTAVEVGAAVLRTYGSAVEGSGTGGGLGFQRRQSRPVKELRPGAAVFRN